MEIFVEESPRDSSNHLHRVKPQIHDLQHVGSRLHYPVVSSEANIVRTEFHQLRYVLRLHDLGLDLGVVYHGGVDPLVDFHPKTRIVQQLNHVVEQPPLGYHHLQRLHTFISIEY